MTATGAGISKMPAVIAHGRLRAMAAVNVIFVGILLAIARIYQFPPPGVFCLVAEVFFIAALVRATPLLPQSAQCHDSPQRRGGGRSNHAAANSANL